MNKVITNIHQGTKITVELADTVHTPGEMPLALCELMEIPKGAVVADVGCGSGYLGITAALLGAKTVYCIDPSADACQMTQRNCVLNGVTTVKVLQGKELTPILDDKLDVIITNPPQTPFPSALPPMRYGGREGIDVIKRIIQQASLLLKPKGRLYLSHISYANPKRVYAAIAEAGLTYKTLHTIKKPLDTQQCNALHPKLYNYILDLWHKGLAELDNDDNLFTYQHRLYSIGHKTF